MHVLYNSIIYYETNKVLEKTTVKTIQDLVLPVFMNQEFLSNCFELNVVNISSLKGNEQTQMRTDEI